MAGIIGLSTMILIPRRNRDSYSSIIYLTLLTPSMIYSHTKICLMKKQLYTKSIFDNMRKLRFLLEAKAIGLDLKDDYIRQAIDYGANGGVDWVILSNGCIWRVYKISFAKPIDKEMVYEIDFLKLSQKKQTDLDMLYCISKEGLGKSILEEYHLQKQALSRFFIGQIILTDGVIDSIKKVLKKVSPEVKIANEEIKLVLLNEVLKREVLEGEKVEEAKKKISKTIKPVVKKNIEKPFELKPDSKS